MKIFIFITLLLSNLAYGYSYNELLLKAQSAIFPKILLLDKKLDEKLVNGKIVYVIVHEAGDYDTAIQVRRQIQKQFDHQLEQYAFEIKLVDYKEISDELQATAIYALNSEKHLRSVANIAISKGIVTFSYDIANLKNGLLLSLMVEKFTVLYLNKKMLQNYHVDFVDSLYQIVRFTNE